jgi:hypothetical protein
MKGLRLDKPPGEALRRLALKQLTAVRRDLEKAAAGHGVHAARRQIKQLRSLLRLVRNAIGADDFQSTDAALREIAHLLASARRAEAMGEALAKLVEAGLLSAGDANVWVSGLRAEEQPHGNAGAVEAQHKLEPVRRAVKSWRLPQEDTSAYVEATAAIYRHARRSLKAALQEPTKDNLHTSRKAAIHHLHHIQVLSALWPAMMQPWSQELAKLRIALGDINDLDEMRDLYGTSEKSELLVSAINQRRDQLLDQVKASSSLLFAEKTGAFAKRIAAMWREARS